MDNQVSFRVFLAASLILGVSVVAALLVIGPDSGHFLASREPPTEVSSPHPSAQLMPSDENFKPDGGVQGQRNVQKAASDTETHQSQRPPALTDRKVRELLDRLQNATRLERASILEQAFAYRREALVELRRRAREGTVEEQAVACDLLRRARDRRAEAALLAALDSPDATVQERAVQGLRHVGTEEAAKRIRELIGETDSGPLLRAGLAALGELGSTDSIPLLETFLGHEKQSIQVSAAWALAKLGEESVLPVLLEALENDLPYARRVAVQALGNLPGPSGAFELETVAGDSHDPWQGEALAALTARHLREVKGTEQRVEFLITHAGSPDEAVAVWAVSALAKEGSLPDLKKVAEAGGLGANAAKEALLYQYGLVAGQDSGGFQKHAINVHKELFEYGYALLAEVSPERAEFYRGHAYADLHDGSGAEDEQDCDNGTFCIPPACHSPNRHFYNPFTESGLAWVPGLSCTLGVQDSAKVSALDHWKWAVEAYAGNNLHGYNNAFHLLGQVVHLLSDMTSPAHVHLDNHMLGDDFETWCETWVNSHFDLNEFISILNLAPKFEALPDMTLGQMFSQLATFTYNFTAYRGVLATDPDVQSLVNMELVSDSSHELGNMFGITYYDGVFDTPFWVLLAAGNIALRFHRPQSLSSTTVQAGAYDEWWPAEGTHFVSMRHEVPCIEGRFYIENIVANGTQVTPLEFPHELRHGSYSPGDSLCKTYAGELFPECVLYVASLLKYAASGLPASMPIEALEFDGIPVPGLGAPDFEPPTLESSGWVNITLASPGAELVFVALDLPGNIISTEPAFRVPVEQYVDGTAHTLYVQVQMPDGSLLTQAVPFVSSSEMPPVSVPDAPNIWDPDPDFPPTDVQSLSLADNGRLCVVGGDPLQCFQWDESLDVVGGQVRYYYQLVCEAADNMLFLREQGFWYAYSNDDLGIPNTLITQVIFLEQDLLLVGTNRGLFWVEITASEPGERPGLSVHYHYNHLSGLVGDCVTSLELDPRTGAVWVGVHGSELYTLHPYSQRIHWTNGGGVSRILGYPPTEVRNFPLGETLDAENAIRGLLVHTVRGYGEDQFWAVTELGMTSHADGRWTYYDSATEAWIREESYAPISAFSAWSAAPQQLPLRGADNPGGVRRAVLVGVGEYAQDHPAGELPSSEAFKNDVQRLTAVLLQGDYACRWPDENTVQKLDQKATKTGIRGTLYSVAESAAQEDLLLFYVSAHGGRDNDGSFLCTHDDIYTAQELGYDLSLFEPSRGSVVVILDTRHAGGLMPAGGKDAAPSWPFADEAMAAYQEAVRERCASRGLQAPKDIGGNIAFLTAALAEEIAVSTLKLGLFTEEMLRGCLVAASDTNGDGDCQFLELYEHARVRVEARGAQHPQCWNPDLLSEIAARTVGELWAGTSRGIAHWEYCDWHLASLEDYELPGFAVNDLAVDANGVLWVATDEGFGSWDILSREARSHSYGAQGAGRRLAIAPDGEVWAVFSSQEGGTTVSRLVPELQTLLVSPDDNSIFNASGTPPTTVSLQWVSPAEAIASEVFLNGVSQGVTQTGSMDVTLLAGEYSWTVRALYRDSIAGPKAPAWSFTVVHVPPPPPASVDFMLLRMYVDDGAGEGEIPMEGEGGYGEGYWAPTEGEYWYPEEGEW